MKDDVVGKMIEGIPVFGTENVKPREMKGITLLIRGALMQDALCAAGFKMQFISVNDDDDFVFREEE